MANASFDPGGYFEFDLARGAVRARGGERVLVLAGDVLAPLVSAAVGNGDLTAVRKMGRQLGEAVLQKLNAPMDQPMEAVLGHAAAVLSIFGWGRLEMERWGDALVAALEDLPALDEDHLGVAALLGGLLSSLGGTEVACVPVGRDGRFMVVDPSVAQQIWKWARGGDGVATIVSRLAPENA